MCGVKFWKGAENLRPSSSPYYRTLVDDQPHVPAIFSMFYTKNYKKRHDTKKKLGICSVVPVAVWHTASGPTATVAALRCSLLLLQEPLRFPLLEPLLLPLQEPPCVNLGAQELLRGGVGRCDWWKEPAWLWRLPADEPKSLQGC
jgi:hypothetical protein